MAAKLTISYPKRGVYVQIKGPGVSQMIVPYKGPSVGHDTSQIYSQPIPEIIQWAIGSSKEITKKIGGWVGLIGAGAEAAAELADILGVKLYNASYYSQAWKGAQPSETSLTIDLKAGWKNEYNGKTEVVDPLKTIYRGIVPSASDSDGSGFLRSPGPTTFTAIKDFITKYWKSVDEDGTAKTLTSIEEGVSSEKRNPKGSTAGKWTLDFAYFNGTDQESVIFLRIKDLVAIAGSLKLDTTLIDSNGVPCAGILALSFKSNSITVESDIDEMFLPSA